MKKLVFLIIMFVFISGIAFAQKDNVIETAPATGTTTSEAKPEEKPVEKKPEEVKKLYMLIMTRVDIDRDIKDPSELSADEADKLIVYKKDISCEGNEIKEGRISWKKVPIKTIAHDDKSEEITLSSSQDIEDIYKLKIMTKKNKPEIVDLGATISLMEVTEQKAPKMANGKEMLVMAKVEPKEINNKFTLKLGEETKIYTSSKDKKKKSEKNKPGKIIQLFIKITPD